MRTALSTRARVAHVLLVGAAFATGVTGCGTDTADSADSTTTTAGPLDGDASGAPTPEDSTPGDSAAESTTTVPGSTPAPSGGDIEGSWTADAQEIFAASTANIAGVPSMDCSGPITLAFSAEGRFAQTGTAQCSIRGTAATVTFDNTGNYSVDGSQVTIDGTSSNTSITTNGVSIPTTAGMGDNTAEFDIAGDTLTITFTIAPAGTVVQTYTRT